MYFLIFYEAITWLFWPALIIGLVIFLIRRRNNKKHPSQNKEWYLQFALSREDAVSQLFLLLSFFFLGLSLLSLNRDLGNPFLPQTILLAASLIGLAGAYYLKTIYTLLFSLGGAVSWWVTQSTQWITAKNIAPSSVLIGLVFIALLFYALGQLHYQETRFRRFAMIYLVLGIISLTGILFFFSLKFGVYELGQMTSGIALFASWQLTISLLLLLASVIGTTLYGLVRKALSAGEALAVLVLVVLFGLFAFLSPQQMSIHAGSYFSYFDKTPFSSTGIIWAIVFNIAVFLELLGLIFSGYRRGQTWLINLGALFLFLLIIVKYFDWFFSFLDKSIFFIGAGILLFALGWFMERSRRYMVSQVKTPAA